MTRNEKIYLTVFLIGLVGFFNTVNPVSHYTYLGIEILAMIGFLSAGKND